jgi:hypothetical protein
VAPRAAAAELRLRPARNRSLRREQPFLLLLLLSLPECL